MEDFERPKTYVQWMLGNRCNYNCSYCLDIFKRGDYNPPNEDIFIETCKDIIYHYDELGRDVVFEFIGGEPTLMDKIPEVGQRLHNYPTNMILRTNGSASIEWWQKSIRYLSEVVISVHREFADLEHIQNVIKLLQDNRIHPIKLQVLFPVTLRPESWEWGIKCVHKFRKRYKLGELQLLYSNFGRGSDTFLPYKEEQWKQFNQLNDIIVENMSYEPEKSFKGFTCYSGLDTLVIDAIGNIYRGWCLQGNKIGNVNFPPINYPTEPIICQKDYCKNGFDKKAKKEP